MRCQLFIFLCFCAFSVRVHNQILDEKIAEVRAACVSGTSAQALLMLSLKELGDVEVGG